MKEVSKFEVNMSDNAVVTAENIVRTGEVLALCAVKFRIARIGSKGLHGIYQGLIHDICRDKIRPNHTVTDMTWRKTQCCSYAKIWINDLVIQSLTALVRK